jgi:hypothetical protein
VKDYTSNRSAPKGQLQFVLTALALFIGIYPTAVVASSDRQIGSFTSAPKSIPVKISKKDSVANPKGKLPITDGIYLYGQSPESNRLGQEYMVFEMRQGKVKGAFYLPQSEFSCFQGTLTSGKLSVTVAADADSEADTAQVAAAGTQTEDVYGDIPSSYAVGLQNYYQLTNISNNDRRILTACQQDSQH